MPKETKPTTNESSQEVHYNLIVKILKTGTSAGRMIHAKGAQISIPSDQAKALESAGLAKIIGA